MVKLGVSIYPTLSIEKAFQGLKQANDFKLDFIFTSLHLPESKKENIKKLDEFFKEAIKLDIFTIADISPSTIDVFKENNLNLDILKKWGIKALRFDYGFSFPDILEILKLTGLEPVLNASDLNVSEVKEFLSLSRKKELTLIHNFYPAPETGLSYEYYLRQNKDFKELNLKIGAFIPSLNNPRQPLFAGLPTLERHRQQNLDLLVLELLSNSDLDYLCFGDPLASTDEINLVKDLINRIIPLSATLISNLPPTVIDLLNKEHQSRPDEAEYVIRSNYSRSIPTPSGIIIEPFNTVNRPAGSITIANNLAGRYVGELQIVKQDLPPKASVNVVGYLSKEATLLLPFIKGKDCFKFILETVDSKLIK